MADNIIYFENELTPGTLPADIEKALHTSLNTAIAALLGDELWSVSLIVTGDAEIREINRERRKTDRPTDVLSFPMWYFSPPCEASEELFEEEDGSVMLGDIVISFETAIRQAEAYGHSLLRECVFLAIHSVLHLVGYDHVEEADREIMEDKQNEIMLMLGISR